MDIEKTISSLKKEGFEANYYATGEEAAAAIAAELTEKTIGIGGSHTIETLGLYDLLSASNEVFWHWKQPAPEARKKAAAAQVYLTSANAIAETGEIVNIDGSGNRIASMFYGHEKVIIIAGVNKITPDLESAIWRAKNIASPLNAIRLHKKTPCAMSQPMKCHNCSSPDKICRGIGILQGKMLGIKEMEVVLIGQELGY